MIPCSVVGGWKRFGVIHITVTITTIPTTTTTTDIFLLKGAAADATDAPQPWGLLCNHVMKMRGFLIFHFKEYRWNEIDRGKPKYSGKNLSQFHFVHHKSRKDRPGIEPWPPRWEAGD
jgi:hypothetical protein